MIQAKALISGHITRVDNGRFYTRTGDTTHSFNMVYYRMIDRFAEPDEPYIAPEIDEIAEYKRLRDMDIERGYENEQG